jgi:hypothetical protein
VIAWPTSSRSSMATAASPARPALQSREGLPILTAPHVVEALAPFFANIRGRPAWRTVQPRPEGRIREAGFAAEKAEGDHRRAYRRGRVQGPISHLRLPRRGEENPFGVRSRLLRERLGDVWAVDGRSSGCLRRRQGRRSHAGTHRHSAGGRLRGRHRPPASPLRKGQAILVGDQDQELRRRRVRGRPDRGRQGQLCRLRQAGDLLAADADRSAGPTKDNTFEAGIKGKRDQWLADLLHADHKIVTIRYFGYTKGGTGKPRMGVAIKWHGDRRVL